MLEFSQMSVVKCLDKCLSYKRWTSDGEKAILLRQVENILPSFKRRKKPYFEKRQIVRTQPTARAKIIKALPGRRFVSDN